MLANTSDMPKTRQWTTQERVWCFQKYLDIVVCETQQNFLYVFWDGTTSNQVRHIQDGEEISMQALSKT